MVQRTKAPSQHVWLQAGHVNHGLVCNLQSCPLPIQEVVSPGFRSNLRGAISHNRSPRGRIPQTVASTRSAPMQHVDSSVDAFRGVSNRVREWICRCIPLHVAFITQAKALSHLIGSIENCGRALRKVKVSYNSPPLRLIYRDEMNARFRKMTTSPPSLLATISPACFLSISSCASTMILTGTGSWRRRRALLVPHTFLYYFAESTAETDLRPHGVIDLLLYTDVEVVDGELLLLLLLLEQFTAF